MLLQIIIGVIIAYIIIKGLPEFLEILSALFNTSSRKKTNKEIIKDWLPAIIAFTLVIVLISL